MPECENIAATTADTLKGEPVVSPDVAHIRQNISLLSSLLQRFADDARSNFQQTCSVGKENDTEEEETAVHRMLLYMHIALALLVFSALSWIIKREGARMRKLELAREDRTADSGEGSGELSSSNRSIGGSRATRRKTSNFVAEYVLYRVDYLLSNASFAKPLLLLLLTYVTIIIGGITYSYLGGVPVLEALWLSWTMVADPGAHGDTQGTLLRAVSLTLTLAGMLVFALMIGIVADGVSSFLDSLKQGHSGVVEMEHTLILGWSQKTIPCVREICLANKSLNGTGVIVILADREKQAMEAELAAALAKEDMHGTLVVCRSGKVTSENDLRKVSARHARAIIVLADTNIDADASDARAVRVVMCLTKIFQEGESIVNGHVVVELCDIDNKDLIPLIAPMRCEVVVSHDMIGRMMIVCARQPGLTHVLQELLTFEGAEFYFKRWPELAGKTFLEAHFAFPNAIVVGVRPFDRADAMAQLEQSKFDIDLHAKQKRKVLLNPPDDYILHENDDLLVLAEDDDTYQPVSFDDPSMTLAKSAMKNVIHVRPPAKQGTIENFLFCGSRRDLDDMIAELDQMVVPGSTLTLMSIVETSKLEKRLLDGGLALSSLKQLKVNLVQGNHALRRDLEKLPLETFTSILILAEEEYENIIDEADSRTLTCLLLIRDIISKRLSGETYAGSGKIRPEEPAINDSIQMPSEISNSVSPLSFSRRLPFKRSGSHGRLWRRSPKVSRSISLENSMDGDTSNGSPRLQEEKVYRINIGQTVILCEILDTHTKALLPIAKVTDNLLSNEIVSGCLSLIAESPSINEVLSELLHPEGNDIKLVPAVDYGSHGERVSFWELASRVRARHEILLGYKIVDHDAVLNPEDKTQLITLGDAASLIIMSENIYTRTS